MGNHYKYQHLLLQIPLGSQVGVSPHNFNQRSSGMNSELTLLQG